MDIEQQEKDFLEFIYIGFGAILGAILTLGVTLVTDFFRRKKRAKEFRKIVLVELQELQVRLALTFYIMADKRGVLTIFEFKWICKLVKNYEGIAVSQKIREGLEQLEGKEEAELRIVFKTITKPETSRESAMKFTLTALKSGLLNLGQFRLKESRILFDILNLLDLYNQTVDDYRHFFALTFDPGIPENYQIATKNLSSAEGTIMSAAKALAEKIDLLK